MRALIVATLMAASASAAGLAASSSSPPPIWPLPASYSSGDVTRIVSPAATVTTPCATNTDLEAAIRRFKETTFSYATASPNPSSFGGSAAAANVEELTTIAICMKEGTAPPLVLGMDESYSLSVGAAPSSDDGSDGIRLDCTTQYGCYRGLESLSQLIGFGGRGVYSIERTPWRITDAPRFSHRGLMIDTSRHFLPPRVIRSVLDGMAYAKLNTMHWHMMDAIAFPFNSPSHPKLSEFGSYSRRERYSPADVSAIVDYARALGIRVMVEFDVPGHTGAMCFGEPEICPTPLCTSPNINNWALDITKNYTYEVVGNVIRDLAAIFPEPMLHLGGDEVVYSCWRATPAIMAWLEERGMTVQDGFLYFTKRAHAMAAALGRTVVGWQELWDHFGPKLPKGTVIQQWLPNSVALPLNVTSNGYRLVWSDSSVWYLNHVKLTWRQMYEAEPCNGLPDANCALVIGGEGCLWAEMVDTSVLFQTLYPRLAAIAERLWSPRATAVLNDETEGRLIAFRCLLNERGIAAAPVLNDVARSAPPNPGSCYRQ